LQIISAITGGITDLSFNSVGYAWQTLNCFLTASYSVSIMFCDFKLDCYNKFHFFISTLVTFPLVPGYVLNESSTEYWKL